MNNAPYTPHDFQPTDHSLLIRQGGLLPLSADLHCHSHFSDGVLPPEMLAARAAERGVDLWALTDHDEVSGIATAQQAAKQHGMAFLAGAEISVTWLGRTVHIVGLGLDATDPTLLAGLQQTRSGRVNRAKGMADALAKLGMQGAYEGALKFVSNPELISRTHFARYLVEAGHCASMQQVFDQYLHDDGPAYVDLQWAKLEEAVSWIMSAGGVAVIAHPGRYKYSSLEFDTLFKSFKAAGGLGIEVNTGSHRPREYAQYAQVARDYGFLASIGSDFHGPDDGVFDLGSIAPLAADLKPVWQELGHKIS
jgi:3',5'-nucleoside bisphosphate phosphatase